MYESLLENDSEMTLYILAMDNELFSFLQEQNYKGVVAIALDDILNYDNRLPALKKERSFGEFCWTLSSVLTEYVFETFAPDICTYIDSDMYFYSNPSVLLDSFDKSVGIMRHRFPNNRYFRLLEKHSGTYCVEFNSFRNNEIGRRVLSEWKEKCIAHCEAVGTEKGFGDQKYLTDWPQEYPGEIYEYNHSGAGIATWNIKDYSIEDGELMYRGSKCSPIFYHFSGIVYLENGRINTHVGNFSKEVADYFYLPYLRKIEEKRNWLREHNVIDIAVKTKKNDVPDEARKSFTHEMMDYLKKGKIFTIIREVTGRIYTSTYARTHYGTESDYYNISDL